MTYLFRPITELHHVSCFVNTKCAIFITHSLNLILIYKKRNFFIFIVIKRRYAKVSHVRPSLYVLRVHLNSLHCRRVLILILWCSYIKRLQMKITLRAESFARPKVSRDRKFAKFRGFKFRKFYFLTKIYGKNFCDFLKIFIFYVNNFREWLGKMNKKSFQIFFIQLYLLFLFNREKKSPS